MPTRTAHTAWEGTLETGSGEVDLASSGAGTFEVSFPKRSAEDAGGVTSPEELIAAAHTSCYAMQMSALLAKHGATPGSLAVSADVSLGPDTEGFKITSVHLTVAGTAENIDAEGFRRVAEEAKRTCPVSKALAGVEEMTVDVTFDA
jgi:osmotically inducible protein OsmC